MIPWPCAAETISTTTKWEISDGKVTSLVHKASSLVMAIMSMVSEVVVVAATDIVSKMIDQKGMSGE